MGKSISFLARSFVTSSMTLLVNTAINAFDGCSQNLIPNCPAENTAASRQLPFPPPPSRPRCVSACREGEGGGGAGTAVGAPDNGGSRHSGPPGSRRCHSDGEQQKQPAPVRRTPPAPAQPAPGTQSYDAQSHNAQTLCKCTCMNMLEHGTAEHALPIKTAKIQPTFGTLQIKL